MSLDLCSNQIVFSLHHNSRSLMKSIILFFPCLIILMCLKEKCKILIWKMLERTRKRKMKRKMRRKMKIKKKNLFSLRSQRKKLKRMIRKKKKENQSLDYLVKWRKKKKLKKIKAKCLPYFKLLKKDQILFWAVIRLPQTFKISLKEVIVPRKTKINLK